LKTKFVLLIVCSLNLTSISAQNLISENSIKNTIQTFFDGLHKGDTLLINKSISSSLKLETIYINTDGLSVLKSESKADFLRAVSEKREEDKWEEKLTSITIHIDENLASVWAPYKFYLNSKFSHCGVNSFQLFNNDDHWEIIYLVDTRRKEDCRLE
jgi:hypothetical protein